MDGKFNINVFEDIKHINPKSGIEYWFARELQPVLEYTEWRNFTSAIERAKEACKGSGINVIEHFVDVNKSYKLKRKLTKEGADQLYAKIVQLKMASTVGAK